MNNHKCGLFDIMLPSLVQKIRFSIKLVFCKRSYGNFGKQFFGWVLNENCIHEFIYEPQTFDLKEFLRELRYLLNGSSKIHGNLALFGKFQMRMVMDHLRKNGYLSRPDYDYQYEDAQFDYGRGDYDTLKIIKGFVQSRHLSNEHEEYIIFFKFDKDLEEILKIPHKYRLPDVIYDRDKWGALKNDDYVLERNNKDNITINIDQTFSREYNLIDWTKFEKQGEYDIIIFCDIIKESFTNSDQRKILRSIRCDNSGQIISNLKNIIYHSVPFESIKQISVEIVNQSFKPIEFSPGNSIIVLKFLKK